MDNNWGILGHQWAVDLLRGHLERGKPRHAYLFTGPDGVGKRTLALRFAQALNSPGETPGSFDPTHPQCQQIERMQHADLTVVQRQEGDRDIKIEAVRNLSQTLSLSPYMSQYRIALLLDFEKANRSAANAILKTLEEPPGPVVMMVTASSAEELLPTIVSRCEVIRLRPVPLEHVCQGLQEKWKIEADLARLLAHLSGGRPGYALYLHHHPELLEQRSIWLDEQISLLSASTVVRFAYAERVAKDKAQYQQILLVWLSFWRDVLLRSAQSSVAVSNFNRIDDIERMAQQITTAEAHRLVSVLEQHLREMRTNINIRLAAEVLMLDFPTL